MIYFFLNIPTFTRTFTRLHLCGNQIKMHRIKPPQAVNDIHPYIHPPARPHLCGNQIKMRRIKPPRAVNDIHPYIDPHALPHLCGNQMKMRRIKPMHAQMRSRH